jgi:hypothetical protein
VVTGGLVSGLPRYEVLVREIGTGRQILRHGWCDNAVSAQADHDMIASDLSTLSSELFLHEYGLRSAM